MRSEAEIRAAIATLERLIHALPPGTHQDVMAGEIAGLRYALSCETCNPTLAETLPKMRLLVARLDAERLLPAERN